jgi:hypothetical protein
VDISGGGKQRPRQAQTQTHNEAVEGWVMSAHLPPLQREGRPLEGEGRAGPDYQRISVLGRTIIDRKTVEHTIRVFAQVGVCVDPHLCRKPAPSPKP